MLIPSVISTNQRYRINESTTMQLEQKTLNDILENGQTRCALPWKRARVRFLRIAPGFSYCARRTKSYLAACQSDERSYMFATHVTAHADGFVAR